MPKISEIAMGHLKSGHWGKLAVLTLEELLSKSDYNTFTGYLNNPSSGLADPSSAPRDYEDSITLSTITNAVVVSSGQIFSKEGIDDLVNRDFKGASINCPETRETLAPIGNSYYVELPQLDVAISRLKEKIRGARQSRQLVSKTPLTGPTIQPDSTKTGNLSIQVFNHKIIVNFDTSNPENLEQIALYFEKYFEKKPGAKCEMRSKGAKSYAILGYGRCWSMEEVPCIEVWFPETDLEVNYITLLCSYFVPSLSTEGGLTDAQKASIGGLTLGQHLDILPLPVAMSVTDFVANCNKFLTSFERWAFTNGYDSNDLVLYLGDDALMSAQEFTSSRSLVLERPMTLNPLKKGPQVIGRDVIPPEVEPSAVIKPKVIPPAVIPNEEDSGEVYLKINRRFLRIRFDCPSDSDVEYAQNFFQDYFKNQPEAELNFKKNPTLTKYQVGRPGKGDLGLCWQAKDGILLEFWYPLDFLEAPEVGSLLEAFLTPLGAEEDEVLPTGPVTKLQDLKIGAFADLLPSPIFMDIQTFILCCDSFLKKTLTFEKKLPFHNKVDYFDSPTVPQTETGYKNFVPAPAAPTPARALTPARTPAAPTTFRAAPTSYSSSSAPATTSWLAPKF